MKFACKFINFKSYDFVDGQGKRICGCNAYCFVTQHKEIIKVKVVNPSAIEGKNFGDDITVIVVPRGRYINYEV